MINTSNNNCVYQHVVFLNSNPILMPHMNIWYQMRACLMHAKFSKCLPTDLNRVLQAGASFCGKSTTERSQLGLALPQRIYCQNIALPVNKLKTDSLSSQQSAVMKCLVVNWWGQCENTRGTSFFRQSTIAGDGTCPRLSVGQVPNLCHHEWNIIIYWSLWDQALDEPSCERKFQML